jgi:hypothetical protein
VGGQIAIDAHTSGTQHANSIEGTCQHQRAAKQHKTATQERMPNKAAWLQACHVSA